MAATDHTTRHDAEKAETNNIAALFLRLFWMFLGIMGLMLCVLRILHNRETFFSAADAVYVLLVPLLIGARYLDVTRFRGTTTYGEPATLVHWRRYAVVLLASSAVIWCAAHAIAFALSE